MFSLPTLAGGYEAELAGRPGLGERAATLERTADQVVRDLRALQLAIQPPALDGRSLDAALRSLAAVYRRGSGPSSPSTWTR